MKIKAFLLVVLATFFGAPEHLSADIILLHGSKVDGNATKLAWFLPPVFEEKKDNPNNGLFFAELSEQAKRLGLGKVVPFTWNGKSGPPESRIAGLKQHIEAAERLTQMIRDGFAPERDGVATKPVADAHDEDGSQDVADQVQDEPIKLNGPLYLVGHSNGGVICEIVSQMLYNPHAHPKGKKTPSLFALDSNIMDVKPSISDAVEDSLGANNGAERANKNDEQASSEAGSRKKRASHVTLKCRKLLAGAVARVRQTYDPSDRHQIKVAQLIMMASPIDVSLYSVNMQVVDKVCALFSKGDGIQRFFGRTRYPEGDNVMNFRVTLKSLGGGIYYPMHTQMIYPSIARYVLDLLSNMKKATGLRESKFKSTKGVDVLFDERSPEAGGDAPVFKIIEKLKVHAFKASGLSE